MILLFPDTDTLSIAVTSGIVGPDVTLAPAAISLDDQGRIYVEPTVTLSASTRKNLDRVGVKGSKRHGSDQLAKVANWLQIVPLAKEPGTPQLSSQTPVLFELSEAGDLPVLVAEMLRLGNDRQSFRWFADGESSPPHVLLRVVGPPYYTLLRALDQSASGTTGHVRAYVERSPRIWVELGYAHPFAAQLRAPEGQHVLVRSPRDWRFLDDEPFHDVYDIVKFDLPAVPVAWNEAPAAKKLTVPMRLTAGNAADVPELWVLRDDAAARVDAFVRDADERLIQRLTFAVAAEPGGKQVIVLRTRPSKLPPPALPLESALAFKPYWKLPNLFVPVGKRLHPTLRRDAVRRLLADDPDQVVWLAPDDRGGFTPENVPDSAFRSLEDWVDYVIETEQAPLAAWIAATRFDFDHFVCTETGGPKPPRPDHGEGSGKDAADESRPAKPVSSKPGPKAKTVPKPPTSASFVPPPPEAKPPSERRIRREALEKQFLDSEGSLDTATRLELWPELATANAGEGSRGEAAVCWLNALWITDPLPPEWLAEWARCEYTATGGTVRAEDLDKRLAGTTQSVEDARAVAAGFLWLAAQNPVPPWLMSRLPAIQKYLEVNAAALPVRAVWLAGSRLAQLSGADVLGLARLRDRLLQRLLDEGLKPERDLPLFLRYAGKDSARLRVVRDKALELRQAVRKWTEHIPQNLPYVDLMFAFALAKLGETDAAKRLVEEARRVMDRPVPETWPDNAAFDATVTAVTSQFLFKGFRYRAEQAIAGKPHAGPLPPDLAEELEAIGRTGKATQAPKPAGGSTDHPYRRAEYTIDYLRKQSDVLDPEEHREPYAVYIQAFGDPLRKELLTLASIQDPGHLVERVRRFTRRGFTDKQPAEVRFFLLHEALPLAPRAGESFSLELLALVPNALAAGPGPTRMASAQEVMQMQGQLLERSLFVGAHFGRTDLVRKLVDQFAALVQGKPQEQRFKLINVVAGQCLRSLRRLAMRDEIDLLLQRLQKEVMQGATLAELRTSQSANPGAWWITLRTLLNLAAGWLTFGLTDRAIPILDEARTALLTSTKPGIHVKDFVELGCSYIEALGHGSAEAGLQRIGELVAKQDATLVPNTWTGNRCYSQLHLRVVEEIVLALVSDEFALGPAARKWLDDDEYFVRKRIHADMRRAKDLSGL